jgi:hypothetical protein
MKMRDELGVLYLDTDVPVNVCLIKLMLKKLAAYRKPYRPLRLAHEFASSISVSKKCR